MKKLVFAFAAIVAVSFASCGGNTVATTEATDSVTNDTVKAVIEDSLDSDSPKAEVVETEETVKAE